MKCHQLFFFASSSAKAFQHFLRHRRRCNGLLRLSRYAAPLCRGLPYNALGSLGLRGSTNSLRRRFLQCTHVKLTRSPYCHSQPQKPPNFPLPPAAASHTVARLSLQPAPLTGCPETWSSQNLLFGGK